MENLTEQQREFYDMIHPEGGLVQSMGSYILGAQPEFVEGHYEGWRRLYEVPSREPENPAARNWDRAIDILNRNDELNEFFEDSRLAVILLATNRVMQYSTEYGFRKPLRSPRMFSILSDKEKKRLDGDYRFPAEPPILDLGSDKEEQDNNS